MAKNSFLYGRLLFIAVCFYSLFSCPAVAQQQRPTSNEGVRSRLAAVYLAELGVQEHSGHNDGMRVEQYLRYTSLGKGHEWCAAFVSWCYAQAGRAKPCNPWAPALLPKARLVYAQGKTMAKPPLPGDVFGIYNRAQKRIVHVGFVAHWDTKYMITVEGNSHNRVERRRRLIATIHSVADWTSP